LKATWDAQAAQPKNQTAKRATPIDPLACGAAAVQSFGGEDLSVYDRDRLQKAQMKAWTQQQMAEKRAAGSETKAEADR